MGNSKRYVRIMDLNKDTNTDNISRVELIKEARLSKNRARVNLLKEIHSRIEQESMETAYGYDPELDKSFTGEFEAIGI
jgi:hypothetical protein|tara:strand:- start:54 stop:290 length:237 start_codon:yes stop_codon:yes gene_type:complete